ncbi:MAG: adenylate kinase [Clostridia bacterium]|nr:adenylate kinase [Clostridia bacterium]
MIILITGATHTGKTLLAQKLLEKYRWPYLSMDHLKMGLIRSGCTTLTPYDDDQMTEYLWPIIREIVKTAVENGQNLIVEGCYVPADWENDFSAFYRSQIRFVLLYFTEDYIRSHYDAIMQNADVIEDRGNDADVDPALLLKENRYYENTFGQTSGAVIIRDFDQKAMAEL